MWGRSSSLPWAWRRTLPALQQHWQQQGGALCLREHSLWVVRAGEGLLLHLLVVPLCPSSAGSQPLLSLLPPSPLPWRSKKPLLLLLLLVLAYKTKGQAPPLFLSPLPLIPPLAAAAVALQLLPCLFPQ